MPRFVCWITAFAVAFGAYPDTAMSQTHQYRLLKLDGSGVRWIMPASKDGKTTLTYSVVTATETAPGAFNCGRITSPDDLLARSGISHAAWRSELRAAFDLWQAVTRITFVELPPGVPAHIKIGAQVDPIGRAFTNVAYNMTADAEPKPITQSLICLNPSTPWKVGFNGDLEVYDLRYTIAHEVGHAIGLDHPMSSGVMMGFKYDERFRDLQPGDVAGVQMLYGTPHPTTSATATPGLGLISPSPNP